MKKGTTSAILKNFIVISFLIVLVFSQQSMIVYSLSVDENVIKSSGIITYPEIPLSSPPLIPAVVTSGATSLHVEGNQIKNMNGDTIYLRGFNDLAHFHGADGGAWFNWNYYDSNLVDNYLSDIASLGINFLRYHTNVKSWLDNPVVSSDIPNLRVHDLYKDFLNRAKTHGIYVMFSDYSVTADDNDHDAVGYSPHATSNEGYVLPSQQNFIDYVSDKVVELGNYDNYVPSFWNEPYWVDDGLCNEWQSVWQSIINNVKSRGYNGLIIAQFTGSLGLWGNPQEGFRNINWYNDPNYSLDYDNLVVSFHIYREGLEGNEVPLNQRVHSYSDLKNMYENDFHLKEISSQVPVICGEIGANLYTDAANEKEFLINSLDIFNEWGIGYLGWILSGATYDMLNPGSPRENIALNPIGDIVVNAIQSGV